MLVVVTDTDNSVFSRITMHLATLNSSGLFLLSCPSSVLVSEPGLVCNTASGSKEGLCSEIFAIGQGKMGIIRRFMGNIP